jgi:hypothetical protein
MPNAKLLAASTLIVAAACGASRSSASRESGCPLTQQDSVFLARGPVYRSCAVSPAAKLVPTSRVIDYRPSRPSNSCSSVEVEMVVDTLGRVESQTAQVLRTNDRAWADAVVASLSTWRYEPARLEGRPVRQIVLERPIMSSIVVAVAPGQSPQSAARAVPRRPSC